jgi:hypothetical protein
VVYKGVGGQILGFPPTLPNQLRNTGTSMLLAFCTEQQGRSSLWECGSLGHHPKTLNATHEAPTWRCPLSHLLPWPRGRVIVALSSAFTSLWRPFRLPLLCFINDVSTVDGKSSTCVKQRTVMFGYASTIYPSALIETYTFSRRIGCFSGNLTIQFQPLTMRWRVFNPLKTKRISFI